MNTDLENTLQTLEGPTLDQPADAILARGDRMRRRRRSATALAGAAGVAALAAAAYVVVPGFVEETAPPIATPGQQEEVQTVDWSGAKTNLTEAELDAMGPDCLSTAWRDDASGNKFVKPGQQLPEDTRPIIAERRGEEVRAIYLGDGYYVSCQPSYGDPDGDGQPGIYESIGMVEPMFQYGGWEGFSRSGGEDSIRVVLPLTPEVAKVTFIMGANEVEASIVENLAVAWTSDPELANIDVADVDFKAYAADGTVLH